MTAIDRQQIIEDAAKAEWAAVWPGIPYETSPDAHAAFAKGIAAAFPVIVAAVLKPIRELHREQFQFCRDCDADYPCPTIQLCDEIESSAKGGE